MASEDEEMQEYVSQALETIGIFDPDKNKFPPWEKKFLRLARKLKVPKSRKTEFFCAMLKLNLYKSLKRILKTEDPTNLKYEEVKKALEKSTLMNKELMFRKKFHARKQRDDETIKKYAKALQNMIKKCKYKRDCKTILPKQFVDGLRNRDTAQHLIENDTLEFETMVEKAIEFQATRGASTSTGASTRTGASTSRD